MLQVVGFFGVVLGGLVAIGYALPARRRHRWFRAAAITLMSLFTALAGMFIAGEALTDPGGWPAVGLIAAWLLPLLGLAALAALRPALALAVLSALTVAVLLLHAWFMVDPGSWRSFEDDVGPVRTVAGFVVVVALAVLGWHRPRQAGWLLITLGVLPIVMAVVAADGRLPITSWTIVGVPAVVTGVLLLLAARATPAPHPASPARPTTPSPAPASDPQPPPGATERNVR